MNDFFEMSAVDTLFWRGAACKHTHLDLVQIETNDLLLARFAESHWHFPLAALSLKRLLVALQHTT